MKLHLKKRLNKLSQNVKESEPNKFNTKEYLIGLFFSSCHYTFNWISNITFRSKT